MLAIAAATVAFDASAQADDALPTRVGRVANVQGSLYHAPDAGNGEWSPIGLNFPVAQGDNLWADHGARAEVDYGGGQFRLAADSNLHVSRLDERQLALFIASGRLIVRVRYLEPDDFVRVDTASTQVALNRPGLYRIDVDADPAQTTLLVREGDADVATADGAVQVRPGQVARLEGTGDVTTDIESGGGLDAFDSWSAERDRVYEASRTSAYVPRDLVGRYDLDTYGDWQTYPEYGAVWFPTVDPEWAPYRFGHWTWLPGWGYTWVDSAPWGYAPFHYGRWAYIRGRWGWCPGALVARPAWAPALVAWYGGGAWTATASGLPVYGWVPLGWGEPFVPWWSGCTARCYARYNRPYAVNVAERPDMHRGPFANWRAPGGVTAVPAATLAGGRPVAINRVPIATDRPATPPLAAPPPVTPLPVRLGAMRPGNGAPPPAARIAAQPVPPAPPPPAPSAIRLPPRSPAPPGAPAPALRIEPRSPVAPVAPIPPLRPEPQSTVAPVAPFPALRTEPRVPAVPQPLIRPVPVPPPAPAPPPIRVPPPSLPLPRMPAAPVPGVAPAPPAAIVPVPRAVPPPAPVAPAPRVVPSPAPPVPVPVPAPVPPAPRPPASAG